MLAGIVRNRLGNRARAASNEGPLRHLAVDLADVVMQQNVRGPRRGGSAVGPDRPGDAARGLHLWRFEPLVEQLGN